MIVLVKLNPPDFKETQNDKSLSILDQRLESLCSLQTFAFSLVFWYVFLKPGGLSFANTSIFWGYVAS